MRLPHPRGLTASLLGAALLVSSACSTTPPPATTPTASASTQVPIPTATPTANTSAASPAPYDVLANVPPDATAHTVKGAEAFARYFFEASSKVVENPSPGQFSRLCTPGALACVGRESKVLALLAKGQRVSGPELTAPEAVAIPDTPLPDQYAYVTVLIRQLPTRRLDVTGADLGEYTPGGTYGMDIKLTWTSNGWRAVQIGDPSKTKPQKP